MNAAFHTDDTASRRHLVGGTELIFVKVVVAGHEEGDRNGPKGIPGAILTGKEGSHWNSIFPNASEYLTKVAIVQPSAIPVRHASFIELSLISTGVALSVFSIVGQGPIVLGVGLDIPHALRANIFAKPRRAHEPGIEIVDGDKTSEGQYFHYEQQLPDPGLALEDGGVVVKDDGGENGQEGPVDEHPLQEQNEATLTKKVGDHHGDDDPKANHDNLPELEGDGDGRLARVKVFCAHAVQNHQQHHQRHQVSLLLARNGPIQVPLHFPQMHRQKDFRLLLRQLLRPSRRHHLQGPKHPSSPMHTVSLSTLALFPLIRLWFVRRTT
mmetsp:Transcript_21723/g.39261  ORF Transcript_21723/g.39261 Transcript_21723/m.39261 type:complete len:325 (-) Transcript_21723:69-1043(-)